MFWFRLAWLVGLEMTAFAPSPPLHLSFTLTSACHYTPSSASFPFVLDHYVLSFSSRASFFLFFTSTATLRHPYFPHSSPLLPTHSSFYSVVDKKAGKKNVHYQIVILSCIWLKTHVIYHACQYRIHIVSYRSRTWDRDSTGVASPPLGCFPVLLVGSFKHLLHITDLVLTHRWHIHITPETWWQSRNLVMWNRPVILLRKNWLFNIK